MGINWKVDTGHLCWCPQSLNVISGLLIFLIIMGLSLSVCLQARPHHCDFKFGFTGGEQT